MIRLLGPRGMSYLTQTLAEIDDGTVTNDESERADWREYLAALAKAAGL